MSCMSVCRGLCGSGKRIKQLVVAGNLLPDTHTAGLGTIHGVTVRTAHVTRDQIVMKWRLSTCGSGEGTKCRTGGWNQRMLLSFMLALTPSRNSLPGNSICHRLCQSVRFTDLVLYSSE